MSHLQSIEELAGILRSTRRKSLSTVEIHGLLTAAACGPEVLGPARWLPYIFHKTKDFGALLKSPAAEKLLEVLVSLHEDLLFSIRQATFVPYLGTEAGAEPSMEQAQPWCVGFFYGMHLHGDAWTGCESEELANLTAPIFYLANPEEAREQVGRRQADKLEGQHDLLIRAIGYNVPRIYDFFNLGRDPEEKKRVV